MVTQIKCNDPKLKDQIEELLNVHMCSIDDLVYKLEMDVVHTEEGGGEPLYLCRVLISDLGSGSLVVEEHQSDLALSVNRALSRIVRRLMRRQLSRQ